jgi:hypothetical protein
MKRIIMCAAAIALAALSAFASGVADGRFGVGIVRAEGPIVEKEIPISSFVAVDVSGIGSVRWTESATPKLVVRTNESVMKYLDCQTTNGALRLGFKPGVGISGLRVLEFELSGPAFGSLDLSGSSTFVALSPWVSPNINIDISGSGSVTADLDASRAAIDLSGSGALKLDGEVDDLRLDLSGSGSATVRDIGSERIALTISGGGGAVISGETERFDVHLSGSGAVSGKELKAKRVVASIAGSGKVEISATETLDADASGAGSVRYWGNPRVNARTSGASKILAGN